VGFVAEVRRRSDLCVRRGTFSSSAVAPVNDGLFMEDGKREAKARETNLKDRAGYDSSEVGGSFA